MTGPPARPDPATVLYSGRVTPEVAGLLHELCPPGLSVSVVPVDDLAGRLPGARYLMGSIGHLDTATLVAAAQRSLRLVQLVTAGYDRFNMEGARAARLPVATNGGANAIAVAEHAILLMLAVRRRLCDLDAQVRAGGWTAGTPPPLTSELTGCTVGLVGFGPIAQEVARRLSAWDVRIRYHTPSARVGRAEPGAPVPVPLDDLLAESDVVSLHAPLTPRSARMIDERALARTKRGAVLVNTARGGLVDEAALVEALWSGRLAGAGLDTVAREPIAPDHPLLGMDRVVLTPHVAGASRQSWPRRLRNGFENILRVERGEAPRWVVRGLAGVGLSEGADRTAVDHAQ